MAWIISILIAYVVGAVPTGAWLARIVAAKDITRYGSGNIGATNVARALGMRWFFVVFFIDALKAYAVMQYMCGVDGASWYCISIAAALLVGNGYSIFLRGKGGKGIATSFGIIAAYSWFLLSVALTIWLVVLAITRNVGIASVMSCGAVIGACVVFSCSCFNCSLVSMCAVWCIWRHRKNIWEYVRLLQQ